MSLITRIDRIYLYLQYQQYLQNQEYHRMLRRALTLNLNNIIIILDN